MTDKLKVNFVYVRNKKTKQYVKETDYSFISLVDTMKEATKFPFAIAYEIAKHVENGEVVYEWEAKRDYKKNP